MMYQEPFVTLVNGDCREVLIGLPAESVDMVMTSSPYYGLRSYKADPAVWDSVNGCQHEWADHYQPAKGGHTLPDNPSIVGAQRIINADNSNPRFGVHSSFCHLCGAWRGQLGSEPDPDLFIKHLCDIFDLVKRVLKKTGSMYVNLDDSHAGSNTGSNDYRQIQGLNPKRNGNTIYAGQRPGSVRNVPAKSLIGIPERFMLEMIRRGWICRNVLIWKKDSVMPESVKDRFTIDFERIFFFSKSPKYFFERQFEPSVDQESYTGRRKRYNSKYETPDYSLAPQHFTSVADGTLYQQRNKRSVWTINPQGFAGPHYATYPEELCRVPIEASCPEQICSKCGKPRVKVYEENIISQRKPEHGIYAQAQELGNNGANSLRQGYRSIEQKLVGLSDCDCGVPFEPGTVLDPFSGVATTSVMAKKLGRRSIGIEISEKYHRLAISRIQGVTARMI